MKTIRKQILLLSVLLVSVMSYATNNNLVIFSQDGNKFTVILNGLRQNEKPETNVKVTGLNASTYKVKVIFENTALGSFDQTAYLMDGGNEVSNKEFSYSIEQKKKGDWKLKPSSIADIPQTPVNTPDQVVYVFNPSGNATPAQTSSTTISTTTTTTGQTETVSVGMSTTVTETPQTTTTNVNMNDGTGTTTQQTTTTTTTGDGASVNMNAGGVGINVTIVDNMGGATSTTTTTTTTSSSSTTTSGTTQPVQPVNTATQCYYAMSSADFANAKSSVEKQSFEDGKLKVAKQILSTNCMSVAQVKEIMAMFSFEETKLDWAKFAYGKTTDPNNYYQLNDGFTYSSSVDELNEYIETKK